MYKDNIITKVWKVRDAYVKKYQYNLDNIVDDLCQKQNEHLNRLVNKEKEKRSRCRG